MKKIFVTGGSGFIGINLCKYLSETEEYKVYSPSSKEIDLLDAEVMEEYLRENQFDVVIHAANYGIGIDKTKDETKILENILKMFLNLQKNSNLYGKLIHLGSGAEFDKRYPIIEVREEEVGETIPQDQYGLAKYIIGKMTENETNVYNLRLFGIFGPYEYWPVKFISNICCKAIKDLPMTIRQDVFFDYLWIEDFCKIIKWFIKNEPQYHTYNVTTGIKINLIELCQTVLNVSGKNLPVYVCKDGYANEYTSNNQRLMKEIGDFEFTPIEVSIEKLYRWYLERQEMIDITKLLYQ
ncbi:MAG: NAD(P)-dependent oxidoreductase [Lachnospiraceae bacterium]|nr:NAD(P)-dependent oxidoreductase [Lachnospiraceae bacterium]